ncbi:MAG: CoA pyrophosphatase [Acidobacteriota bacterium]
MSDAPSWIIEVRKRLETPGKEPLVEGTARRSVMVGLSVDAGELWVLMIRRFGDRWGSAAFPGSDVEPGEDVWTAALRGAEDEIDLPQKAVLRLGELDGVEDVSGGLVTPCIGALPAKFEAKALGDDVDEVFRVPLSVLNNPQLVEEEIVEVEGVQRRVRSYHVGGRRIWGLAVYILEDLMERLQGEPS